MGMEAGYIGAAANVVSGIMQSIAASQANRKMFQAFEKELKKQGGYRGQAFTGLGQYLPSLGVETAQQQMQQGAQQRVQDYGAARVPMGFGEGPTPRDLSYLDMVGQNRAKLSSYGDWGTQQALGRSRYEEGLRRIEDTARGSLNVFPYEMYKAQHSMDELAFWGNLISSVGGSAGSWQSLFGTGPQGAGAPTQPSQNLYDLPQGYLEQQPVIG
jgi:hypothetical protein